MDELREHKDEMTIIAITHRKAVIRPEDHVIELPSRRPADIPEDEEPPEDTGARDETLLLSK